MGGGQRCCVKERWRGGGIVKDTELERMKSGEERAVFPLAFGKGRTVLRVVTQADLKSAIPESLWTLSLSPSLSQMLIMYETHCQVELMCLYFNCMVERKGDSRVGVQRMRRTVPCATIFFFFLSTKSCDKDSRARASKTHVWPLARVGDGAVGSSLAGVDGGDREPRPPGCGSVQERVPFDVAALSRSGARASARARRHGAGGTVA